VPWSEWAAAAPACPGHSLIASCVLAMRMRLQRPQQARGEGRRRPCLAPQEAERLPPGQATCCEGTARPTIQCGAQSRRGRRHPRPRLPPRRAGRRLAARAWSRARCPGRLRAPCMHAWPQPPPGIESLCRPARRRRRASSHPAALHLDHLHSPLPRASCCVGCQRPLARPRAGRARCCARKSARACARGGAGRRLLLMLPPALPQRHPPHLRKLPLRRIVIRGTPPCPALTPASSLLLAGVGVWQPQ
jgi:hypothetical protein